MNSSILAEKWDRVKNKVRSKWSKLTDNDMKSLNGHTKDLRRTIEERYGCKKKEADRQVNDFIKEIQ